MKKEHSSLLICILIMPLLIGANDTFQLKKSDAKIIDFSKAIEFCKPGGETIDDSSGVKPSHDSDQKPQVTNNASVTSITEKAPNHIIIIEINGISIKYSNEDIQEDELVNRALNDIKKDKNTTFVLKDDYADDVLFRAIIGEFKNHKGDGINFTIE